MTVKQIRIVDSPSVATSNCLVEACVQMAAGESQEGVSALVVMPTPDAAAVINGKAQSLPELARQIIAGVHDAAGTLAPRMLTRDEEAILITDVRARGCQPSQIKEALRLLAGEWDQGGYPAPDTYANPDAGTGECVRCLLQELAHRNALLAGGLVAYALACLQENQDAYGARPETIVAGNAQVMGPAALKLLSRLAEGALYLCGDSTAPNAREFETFFPQNQDCDVARIPAQELCPGLAPETEDAGVHEESTPLGAGHAYMVKWTLPSEEAAGITAYIDLMLAQGYTLEDIYLATPHAGWSPQIVRAIEAAGIPGACTLTGKALSPDPRNTDVSLTLQTFAAIGITADARDIASWRTWLALGLADLASGAWTYFEDVAGEKGLTPGGLLGSLIDLLSGTAPEAGADSGKGGQAAAAAYCELAERDTRARHVLRRIQAGLAQIAHARNKCGGALADSVDPARSAPVRLLIGGTSGVIGSRMDATGLFERACARLFTCGFVRTQPSVRVGTLEEMVGVHPRLLILSSCNEGLYDAGELSRALALGVDHLVISTTQRMQEDVARSSGAHIRRTRGERGVRMALLAPNPVIASLGRWAPSTMSGQQFASQIMGVRP